MSFFHYSFEDKLLIGCETVWQNNNLGNRLSLLKQTYGIKHLLTLTIKFIPCQDEHVEHHHIPIRMIPNKEQADQAIGIIENALSKEHPIAIHCTQGIDRTGCVIGCYLVKQGHDPDKVIDQLVYHMSKKRKRGYSKEILKLSYELLYEYV